MSSTYPASSGAPPSAPTADARGIRRAVALPSADGIAAHPRTGERTAPARSGLRRRPEQLPFTAHGGSRRPRSCRRRGRTRAPGGTVILRFRPDRTCHPRRSR